MTRSNFPKGSSFPEWRCTLRVYFFSFTFFKDQSNTQRLKSPAIFNDPMRMLLTLRFHTFDTPRSFYQWDCMGLPHPAWQAGTQAMKRAKQQAPSPGHESLTTSGCQNWWCPTFSSSDAFFLPDKLTAFLGYTGSSELCLRLSQGDRVVWILFIYSVAFPDMVAFPHRPLARYGGYGGGGGGYGGGGYGGRGYGGGDYGGRLAAQNLRSIKTMCAKMRRQWYTCWPDVYLHSMEKIQALSWDSQLWPIMNVSSLCENHHSVLRFQRLWWRWWWVPDAKLESQSSTMLSPGSSIISCFLNAERGPGYGKDGKDGGKSKVLCHPVLPTDFSSRSLILLQLFH